LHSAILDSASRTGSNVRSKMLSIPKVGELCFADLTPFQSDVEALMK
jgi:hypothetical protein